MTLPNITWCQFGFHKMTQVKYLKKSNFMGETFQEEKDTLYKICTKCAHSIKYNRFTPGYKKMSLNTSEILRHNINYNNGIPYIDDYEKRPSYAPPDRVASHPPYSD